MTTRKTRNRAIWILLTIGLALLSANRAEAQSSNYELRRQREGLQQTHRSGSSKSTQKEIEDLLKYGNELRSRILETLGTLVYDHYDELNLEQLETLYRIYWNTLQRKYNIFEVASKLGWKSGSVGASDICKAVDGNICACIRNSSQVCSSLELIDKYKSLGGSSSRSLVESANQYFPERLTVQALLKRLQKGELRMTPKLLIGLLQNVQYDSFDNTIRRTEQIVCDHLARLKVSELVYEPSRFRNTKTAAQLLQKILRENAERFPAKEKKAALMLVDHFERDLNSISGNIEHFGTTYENQKINLKYLFELVIPEDLVDPDIIESRNHLEQQMENNNIVDKLLIEKYKHTNPAQLVLEILRQMKYISQTISFPKNVIRALRMHADFWRRDYVIDDVTDFLKLFSAYDNLLGNPNYAEFFNLIESIKQKLTNSKNVDLELTCSMPRPCLRRVLLRILECNMIDDDTKRTVLKFINLINPRGSPLLEEKSQKNFKGYTPFDVSETSRETNQVILTTVTPNVYVPKETKTTLGYSTKTRPPKYLLKDKQEKVTKTLIKKPPKNEVEVSRPYESNYAETPVDNSKIKKTSKQTESAHESEHQIKCKDGQECDVDSSTNPLKYTNEQNSEKKQIAEKIKPNKFQDMKKVTKTTKQVKNKPKSGNARNTENPERNLNHKNKKNRKNSEQKINHYKEYKIKPTPYTHTTITSVEDTSTMQQMKDESTTFSLIQHTTNDEGIVTTEIEKIYLPTTPVDYATKTTVGESTESSQATINEYITTEFIKSTKYPNYYLKEIPTLFTDDYDNQKSFTEIYTMKIPGNENFITQTMEETTSITSDEDCKDSDDCNSEKCKGSSSCSEEGKTSESCDSSNESSGECESVSREQITEKYCEGPDCSETSQPPSSCEGPDCSETSQPPSSCEGPDCSETSQPPSSCEGPDCSETSQPPSSCEGPDCSSTPLPPSSCEGPGCSETPLPPSSCEGPDCSETPLPPSSCEGPDCSEIPRPSPYSAECESSSEEKCSTESVDSCADGKCDSVTIPQPIPTLPPLYQRPPPTPRLPPSTHKRPPPTLNRPPPATEPPPSTSKLPPSTNKRPAPTSKRPPLTRSHPSPVPKRPPSVYEPPPPAYESPPPTPWLPPSVYESPPPTPWLPPPTANRPSTTPKRPPPTPKRPPLTPSRPPSNSRPPPSTPSLPPSMPKHPSSMHRHTPPTPSLPPSTPNRPPVTQRRPPPSPTHRRPPPTPSLPPSVYKRPPPSLSTPPYEHPRLENSEEICSDSNCSASENCEGGSCSKESICDSDNCDSKSSEQCEGPNCFISGQSCEDEDCSSISRATESEETKSSNVPCDGEDCQKKTNKNCQGPNCSSQNKKVCTGLNCPSTTSLDCESGDCSTQDKEFCTGPNCPSTISSNCESGDCSTQSKESCTGSNCPSTASLDICELGDCSTKTKESCTGSNCPFTTEFPTQYKSNTFTANPKNEENNKPKLCSTKDPNRKRKNERLQKVRQLSNSFLEEQTSTQNKELPSYKTNIEKDQQNRKSVQKYIKPQLGPLLKGLSKATKINKFNKNLKKETRLRPVNKFLQTPQSSNIKQLNHSYPYPAGLHKILHTNDLEKISRRQDYRIKAKKQNNNLNNQKIYDMNYQLGNRRNKNNQQTADKNFIYLEQTSPPKLYQSRQHMYSK